MHTKLTSQTILIVGGNGFLGQHLIQDLIERGVNPHRIHILDAKCTRRETPGPTYHRADITAPDDVKTVFWRIKPHVVFHVASPYPFSTNRALLSSVNISGTQNLLTCAKNMRVQAFVYVSSSSVIHDHFSPLHLADETYPLLSFPAQPNFYSHTKAVGEALVLAANRANGGTMVTAALRPASMYGEGDALQIPNLVRSARMGRAKWQMGKGYGFDGTYVGNLTHAMILAGEKLLGPRDVEGEDDMRVEGEAFFVTDDDTYTFPAFTHLVAEFAGHPVKPEDIRCVPVWLVLALVWMVGWVYWVVKGEEMAFSTRVVRMLSQERTFSIDKIKKRLGYRARFTAAEGLRRAVQWHLGHEGEGTGGEGKKKGL
ncbi:NAD(P)-binding protein [Ophiobolus disseminans]|uniref:NAD(P)-binding protein n=1 Tax=Ophiobolus disseminans TaxID=1469910 RepID=A0A6A6ZW51_9PLEO|nr:NAD(P)-binding protein [Ophiobolus disseminans]